MMNLKDPSLLKSAAYIAGVRVPANSAETFQVTNLATGDVVADVAGFRDEPVVAGEVVVDPVTA